MAGEKLNNIDDFERYVHAKLDAWSPKHRVALAAAMAERWFPVYEIFSTREEWGDPAHFRRSLDAVWNHLKGKTLQPGDVSRYMAQVEDSTPHMDEFDDEAAMAACVMLSNSLRCCRTNDNVTPAMQAVISGFYAVDPNWDMELEEQPRLWQQIRVQREFKKQLKLIEEIEGITQFDDTTIRALRKRLRSKDYIGESTPAAEATTGSTITNQTAFETYRQMIENDLKHNTRDWWKDDGYAHGSYLWALMLFSEWSSRYRRRGETINPGFGSSKLADVNAQQALIAKQRARDSSENALVDWGPELQQLIETALQNAPHGFDVTAFDQPHGYGPSMRALWLEAERLGYSKTEVWRHIVTWARHRPSAWELEDQRIKKGLALVTPDLVALLARELSWDTTGNLDYPWATKIDEERWRVYLNDFPDDFMYSLMMDGKNVGGFHDWPETWKRK